MYQAMNYEKQSQAPAKDWASRGYKRGTHWSMGGKYGMILLYGKLPGYQGSISWSNLPVDIGIYHCFGLWCLPF
jgi:hypothetical protein